MNGASRPSEPSRRGPITLGNMSLPLGIGWRHAVYDAIQELLIGWRHAVYDAIQGLLSDLRADVHDATPHVLVVG